MFVRCRDCGWEQDDFWSQEYNPIKSLEFAKDRLMEALMKPPPARTMKGEIGPVEVRAFLLWELSKMMDRVRGMHWWTVLDYESDPDKKCPQCGHRHLTVD